MKRSTTLCFLLLLLGLSLLCGCDYGLGSMINGKSDLPIPDTIVLRNNETGIIKKFESADDVIGVVMALDKGANKAAYILKDVEDYRDVTAIVYEPSDDTLEYALSLLNQ